MSQKWAPGDLPLEVSKPLNSALNAVLNFGVVEYTSHMAQIIRNSACFGTYLIATT